MPIRTIGDESPVRSPTGERRDEEDPAVSLPAFRLPSANHALRLRLMDGPAVPKPWAAPPHNPQHTHTEHHPQPHPQAWIGNTSVYLFISFNTLLYLLHCLEACEIDQYLIFQAREWRGIGASATLRKSSSAHRLPSTPFTHPLSFKIPPSSWHPPLFSFLNHLFVCISVPDKKTTRL